MTNYKKQHTVKIRRKIIAWEETTYEVSCLTEEEAIKIAIDENPYSTNELQNGIISFKSKVDESTIRRLNQEESWILSAKSAIGELPKGELVIEVVATRVVKLIKSKLKYGYWKDRTFTKIIR